MPDLDAHIQAFQDDRTARASLDRINQAEDRALRSSRARRVVCGDCGARELEHFYTAKVGGSTLCAGCFQGRVARGVAKESDTHHP